MIYDIFLNKKHYQSKGEKLKVFLQDIIKNEEDKVSVDSFYCSNNNYENLREQTKIRRWKLEEYLNDAITDISDVVNYSEEIRKYGAL